MKKIDNLTSGTEKKYRGGSPNFLSADWEEEVMQRAKERKKSHKWGLYRGKNLCDPTILERTHVNKRINIMYKVRELSDKQRRAILMLSDFMHDYPKRYIANQLDITTMTLWNWRNDPLFIAELDKELTKRKTAFRLEAYKHTFRRIRRGDRRVIRDYFKMTGDLKHMVDVKVEEVQTPNEDLDAEISRLTNELGISVEQGS